MTLLVGAMYAGVVLPQRERDEMHQAMDGYKHFLRTVLESGRLLEVVFKFVPSSRVKDMELLILITLYLGSV